MTPGFQVSEVIERPVEEVWGFLTSWEHAPQWMKGVEWIRPAEGGPVGPGTRLRFSSRGAEHESTIVTWRPPYELTLLSTQGGITATYQYTCQPVAGGTEVKLQAGCAARGPWRLVRPLISFMMKRADSPQVAALKEALAARGAA